MFFDDDDTHLGKLYDFDDDGKTSMFEAFIAYKMFEEATKEDDDEFYGSDYDFLQKKRVKPVYSYEEKKKVKPVITPVNKDTIEAAHDNLAEQKTQGWEHIFIKLFIVACTLAIFLIPIYNLAKDPVTYHRAVSLVDKGEYAKAKELFLKVDNVIFKDTLAYIELCNGHIHFENGEYELANYDMRFNKFEYLSPEEAAEVEQFRDRVEFAYEAWLKKNSK